jgi:hypothetical protein
VAAPNRNTCQCRQKSQARDRELLTTARGPSG